eukprot:COSAG02_NODE_6574_length_3486_cov_2.401240_1_plen_171_part_00
MACWWQGGPTCGRGGRANGETHAFVGMRILPCLVNHTARQLWVLRLSFHLISFAFRRVPMRRTHRKSGASPSMFAAEEKLASKLTKGLDHSGRHSVIIKHNARAYAITHFHHSGTGSGYEYYIHTRTLRRCSQLDHHWGFARAWARVRTPCIGSSPDIRCSSVLLVVMIP